MNMRILLVISSLLLYACSNKLRTISKEESLEQGNSNNLLTKFIIDIPDTVYRGQHNIPIVLQVKNLMSQSITIRNPKYWGNAFPRLYYGKTDMTIKVKFNLDVLKDTIEIKSQEIFTTDFDFSLDRILDLEKCPLGQYEIYFVLHNNQDIKSNTCVFFVINKLK